MLFTLFGDYIMQRGGEIWVGSLIRIAAEFGLSQQAVRSALSRMSQKGFLKIRHVGNRSYYGPTSRTKRLLEEGERRIFVRNAGAWDRRWHILVYSIPERKRDVRAELRKQLAWIGFAPLSSGSWISANEVAEDAKALVSRLDIADNVEIFSSQHLGPSDERELAARCWDLEGINQRYRAFIEKWGPEFERARYAGTLPDSECFVQRFLLIHEYRKFFFIDPDLPPALLPDIWCGREACELFHAYHQFLAEGANRYFDAVFEAPPSRRRASAAAPIAAGV
jgi:phenylacetic acid degradation operon negative regulatory protein